MQFTFALVSFLFLLLNVKAQQGLVDSLICDSMLKKASSHVYQNNDSALFLYNDVIDFARYHQNYYFVGEAYNELGYFYMNRSDYVRSKIYLDASMKIFNLIADDIKKANLLINYGNLEFAKDNFLNAITYYKKALHVAEKHKDKSLKSKIAVNLSRCYYNSGQFEMAEKAISKSIHDLIQLKDSLTLANAYNNYGAILDKLNKPQEALKYYYEAKSIYQNSHYTLKLVSTLNNIGNLYKALKNYDSAFFYMKWALDIKRKVGNKRSLCISLGNLSELFIETGKLDKAEKLATEMLNIANKNNDKTQQMYAYSYLTEIYRKKDNYKVSYNYLLLYHQIFDSINNAQYKERLNRVLVDMTDATKDLKIERLIKEQKLKDYELNQKRNELKNKELQIYIYLFIFLIVVIVLFFIYFLVKSKMEKKQVILENQLYVFRMQALANQMNPHFIFNILNSIQYNLSQNDYLTTNKYISNFSKLLRIILDNSQQQSINLMLELESLKLYLDLEQMRLKNKFSFKINKKSDLDLMRYHVPPLLLQPFVENSIWHGIMNLNEDSDKGFIEINLVEYDSFIICEIIDNGVGLTRNNEIKNKNHLSHGLKLTKNRIETYNTIFKTNIEFSISEINDKIETTNILGTLVIIKIPKIELSHAKTIGM